MIFLCNIDYDFSNSEKFNSKTIDIETINFYKYSIFIIQCKENNNCEFEIVKYIRDKNITYPIIVISDSIDKIKYAYQFGATFHLKNPLKEEIQLVINQFIPNIVKIDSDYSFDMNNKQLLVNSKPIEINKIYREVIYIFAKHKNNIVTYDMLSRSVWDKKNVSHNTMVATIRDVRKLLPDDVIHNIRGDGYIMKSPSNFSNVVENISIITLLPFTKKLNLLYVEDDSSIRTSFGPILESLFENIKIATNGEEGINIFKENSIDLVITDIIMPKMNGLSMSREIKEMDENIPVIITTSYNDVDFLTEAIEIGVDYYLFKPLKKEKILKALYKITTQIRDKKLAQSLNL
jgi:DNA-binding response OmpR family regulator